MLPLAPGPVLDHHRPARASPAGNARSAAREMSGAPPGGMVTSTLIGRDGNGACACATARAKGRKTAGRRRVSDWLSPVPPRSALRSCTRRGLLPCRRLPPCYTTGRQSRLRSGSASHEHPPPRLGRARACAGLEDRGEPAGRPALSARRAMPASRANASCVALDLADHAAVIAFCRAQKIDLVVVGPEAPLCAGIVDDLAAAGIKAFGPSKAAARLEGSKGFTKDLCKANNIPTAAYERFTDAGAGQGLCAQRRARRSWSRPTGSPPARASSSRRRVAEAEAAIDMMFGGGLRRGRRRGRGRGIPRRRGGVASSRCATARPRSRSPPRRTTSACFDGDTGPNTGGMGAYSPAPVMTPEMTRRTMDEIVRADRARHEGDGRALQGRALRRADDHRRGAEADRVQRALRRSGMPGADAAADVGSRAGAARLVRRHAEEFRPALVPGRRADRGDGGQGLSRAATPRAR